MNVYRESRELEATWSGLPTDLNIRIRSDLADDQVVRSKQVDTHEVKTRLNRGARVTILEVHYLLM
jgi:hypothetical protein